ncbi:porin family protein [Microvirga sp. Marseille-Q2068]|uniref:Porin family protein n=2 Tax=Microvirga mediterraneensis TaxID=2754695 RepID=A0A838BRH6_9HYPH|nr:porin family protein [Microvirga mediterraneensis]
MKRLVLSLSVLIAGPALAADLPRPAVPAMAAPAAIGWSGFYAGVHGAWIGDGGEAERTGVLGVSPDALPTRAGLSGSGPGGGAQLGYLWQFGAVVAGLEADLTAMDVGRSRSGIATDGGFGVRTDLSSQMNWFGSVKGRVGLTMPSLLPIVQETLVYVTGGLAVAQVDREARITVSPPGAGPQASGDDWTTGFVVGAGSEHRLTETISLKSETLYYRLQDETLTLARAGDQASYRFRNDGWISRVGINVRF